MITKKTLQERQNELRSLLGTPAGQEALQDLVSQYAAASRRLKPADASAITYILVHEREQGLISN